MCVSTAQSPTVTDPLQQAYAGVQHYAGDSYYEALITSLTHWISPHMTDETPCCFMIA